MRPLALCRGLLGLCLLDRLSGSWLVFAVLAGHWTLFWGDGEASNSDQMDNREQQWGEAPARWMTIGALHSSCCQLFRVPLSTTGAERLKKMTGRSLRGDVSLGWLETPDVARAADVGKHVESKIEEQRKVSKTESKSDHLTVKVHMGWLFYGFIVEYKVWLNMALTKKQNKKKTIKCVCVCVSVRLPNGKMGQPE